jgi:hypothetical protein
MGGGGLGRLGGGEGGGEGGSRVIAREGGRSHCSRHHQLLFVVYMHCLC